MGVSEFVASQLRNPSGAFGRIVMPRFFNRSSAAINQLTLASLALEPTDRVIEVGFGSGDLIGRIAPLVSKGSVAGVDFSADMVAVTAKRFALETKRIELRCASAENLPYGDESFTKACTVNTIYFWADPAAPLSELSRVLRVGGRIVVSFSPPSALQGLPFTKHGFNLHEPGRVRCLLEDAGFGGIEIVRGAGPRGEFICAIGTKQPAR